MAHRRERRFAPKQGEYTEALRRLAQLEVEHDTSREKRQFRRTLNVAEAHRRLRQLREELELYGGDEEG